MRGFGAVYCLKANPSQAFCFMSSAGFLLAVFTWLWSLDSQVESACAAKHVHAPSGCSGGGSQGLQRIHVCIRSRK